MNTQQLPESLGRYRPVEFLGAGGMGAVFKAHDPLINRMVAIKLVRTGTLDAETRAEYLVRFQTEAQAAGRCMHPSIVAVYDVSREAGDPYIVMELVEGRSLQQLLADPAGGGWPAAVPILLQVLGGLACAHRLGVTHRDIKPANILVTAAGDAKIADFGIARLGEAAARGHTTLTQVGSLLGTPAYMAPEQCIGEPVDQRTDLFAVGAILYQALTGRPPFAGSTLTETIHRLIGPEPASMAPLEAAGRTPFLPVLQRALAKPRDQRFESAEAFAAALRAATAGPAAPAATDPAGTVVMDRRATTTYGGGHWESATLQRVEHALARYLGPVARVLVGQAARQASSPEELRQTLARNLPSAADRDAFLRALDGLAAGPDAARPGDPAAALIGAEAIAAAQAALAFHLGPIARLLVRQAAAQASSAEDFIALLCAHVPRPDEQATLRRRLQAEVVPKLRR